jgi:hypothetical protein
MFPFFYAIKSIIAVWLMYNGAEFVYDAIIKTWIPFLDKVANSLFNEPEKKPAAKEPPPAPNTFGVKGLSSRTGQISYF